MNESKVEPSPFGSSSSAISTSSTPTPSSAFERIEFLSALSAKPVSSPTFSCSSRRLPASKNALVKASPNSAQWRTPSSISSTQL